MLSSLKHASTLFDVEKGKGMILFIQLFLRILPIMIFLYIIDFRIDMLVHNHRITFYPGA